MFLPRSLVLAGAALALAVPPSNAAPQSGKPSPRGPGPQPGKTLVRSAGPQSGKSFARYTRPLRSVSLDLGTGVVTHGPATHDRAATTIADFQNLDVSGFSGIDTGGGFCEWFDAGIKGSAGNVSDLMSSFVFAYCSSKLTPASGGPGASVKLGFYEGYLAGGGSPTTAVVAMTLAGLPANTASSSFFGGFRCFFMKVDVGDLISFADGPIGYSWKFLDNGTGTVNPTGAVLAGTWPYLSCTASCSGTSGLIDGQGMDDTIDMYCPPGTLSSVFTFSTQSGTYSSISMQIDEVTTKGGSITQYNSATNPNPDILSAEVSNVGKPWTASLTLGLGRAKAGNWIMFFGNSPLDLAIPQGALGLNWGSNKGGRMLLCQRSNSISQITGHTGVSGSTSTSASVNIPKKLALVCAQWCAQAVVVGSVSAGGGGGGVRLSSAVSGIVGTNPGAYFSGTPLTGFWPLPVSFTDLSTRDASSWNWSFGDGGTSTLQNPGHTYALPGTYTVSLTVAGPYGSDTETKVGYVFVDEPVVADFSGSPTSGSLPLIVEFTDLSGGMLSSWSWNFGDGGTSTLQNPTHTYSTQGTYTVSLTVSGTAGTDSETKVGYIVVGPAAPPTANFSGSPLSGPAPLGVAFSDLSTGSATTWSWTFGDGGTSTLRNPSHTYALPGTYTVSLSVSGPSGADGETKLDYILVTVPPPVADFSGAPQTGVAPLAVAFTNLSTGKAHSWSWSFGDGGTSTLQSPSHTYSSPGTYTVSLTATGPGGSDVETKTGYIVVSDPPPVANFSGTPLIGDAPLAVDFTNLSTGAQTSWSWDFGDSGTSTLQNPSHTYAAPGTYTVTLIVTGPGGSDGETKVGYVVAREPVPVADFSGTPLTGVAPLAVAFSDISSGTVTAWSWNFGDSGTSTLQNPSHTYALPGTYTVSLIVTGPGGSDGETKVGYIVVSVPPPVANFSGAPRTGVAPLAVVFSDISSGAVTSWSWDFGDTGTSTLQNPNHTYTLSGLYTVTLTATGPGGSDSETKVGYIAVAPVANFSGTPRSGPAPLAVDFTDLSSGGVTSWGWTFGDAGTSTLQNPSHTYASPGTYTVTLIASSPGGADTASKADYIVVGPFAPPTADFSGTPLSGVAPLAVAFSDLSSGAVTAWSWDFGDTGTSTLQNPGHTYAAAGTYTVSLTATGPGGSDAVTKVGYIVVN